MYLDRHIKEAELLQAIARVNRTAPVAGRLVELAKANHAQLAAS